MKLRLLTVLLIALLAPCAAFAATDCAALAKLTLTNTTITSAESVAAGAFSPPGGKAMAGVPAFCRVAAVSRPSADSEIQFEVWMPASGWNSKFQGVGNGGFAGAIEYGQMGNMASHGYATASTDTGHHTAGTDANWAAGHPEKTVDFGYRAIHQTTVNAKAIIGAFYGKAPRRDRTSTRARTAAGRH